MSLKYNIKNEDISTNIYFTPFLIYTFSHLKCLLLIKLKIV